MSDITDIIRKDDKTGWSENMDAQDIRDKNSKLQETSGGQISGQ